MSVMQKGIINVLVLVGLGIVTYLSPLDKSCVVGLVRGVSERLTTLLFACWIRMWV